MSNLQKFDNLQNFLGKQMQLAFVLCFKKPKQFAKFCCFCGQRTNTSCCINVWFTCLIKRNANDIASINTDLPRSA